MKYDPMLAPLHEAGLDPTAFAFPVGTTIEPIGGGFNSRGFRAGEQVIKVSRKSGVLGTMQDLADTMHDEHGRMADFIWANMPPTNYMIVGSSRYEQEARVVTVQPFIDGPTLPEFVANPKNDRTSTIDFLERCLKLHERKKIIPDVAHVQWLFSIFHSSNVIIGRNEAGEPWPWLTDTNFGKTQRSEMFGRSWHRGIAWGVRRGLVELVKPEPDPAMQAAAISSLLTAEKQGSFGTPGL